MRRGQRGNNSTKSGAARRKPRAPPAALSAASAPPHCGAGAGAAADLPELVPLGLAEQLAGRRARLRIQARLVPEARRSRGLPPDAFPLDAPRVAVSLEDREAALVAPLMGGPVLVYQVEPGFAEPPPGLEEALQARYDALREAGAFPPDGAVLWACLTGERYLFVTDDARLYLPQVNGVRLHELLFGFCLAGSVGGGFVPPLEAPYRFRLEA